MSRFLLAALALVGCSGFGGGKDVTYLCEGGRLATVSLSEDAARVRLGDEEFPLRRVPAASGARYAGERVVLHTKADEALLSVDGRELGPCQQVEPKN